jgi:hypothetical protein
MNGNNENDGCKGNNSCGKDDTHHKSTYTKNSDVSTALSSVTCIPILPNHDVRIKLMTSNVLAWNDNLYQAVCPGGVSPILVDSTNRPTPSPTLKEGHRVSFARRVVSRKMFKSSWKDSLNMKNQIDCSMVATVSRCLHYEV